LADEYSIYMAITILALNDSGQSLPLTRQKPSE
jgi:hypothetical protein